MKKGERKKERERKNEKKRNESEINGTRKEKKRERN